MEKSADKGINFLNSRHMDIHPPYTQLAQLYDQMMSHVDYRRWAKYARKLIAGYCSETKYVIDLSCGTCSFLPKFINRNMHTYASDLSIEMLRKARKKSKKYNIRLYRGSFTEIPLKTEQFDIVFILYDSLNYLLREKLIQQTFDEVHRILKDGGLFIFDVVTRKHCIEHASDFKERVYWDNGGYERLSSFHTRTGYQYTKFIIFQGKKRYTELHTQRIYSTEFLEEMLHRAGFKVAAFDDFTLREAHPDSKRIHFRCIRKVIESRT